MSKIYQKSFSDGKNAGFTLIELLVVVLIIGILAAVALPIYQKAVVKSKVAVYLPWFKKLKEGRKLYILSGGTKWGDMSQFLDALGVNNYRFKCNGYTEYGPCEGDDAQGVLWIDEERYIVTGTGMAYAPIFLSKGKGVSFNIFLNLLLTSNNLQIGHLYCNYYTPEGKEMCQVLSGSKAPSAHLWNNDEAYEIPF